MSITADPDIIFITNEGEKEDQEGYKECYSGGT